MSRGGTRRGEGAARRDERPGGRVPPPWTWWLPTAAVLAIAWFAFHSWKQPNFILIPIEKHLPLAPLYAFFMPGANALAILAVLVLGAAILTWRRVSRIDTRLFLLFVLGFAFTFRLAVHAGREGALPGVELGIPHGEEVIYDVPRIESTAAFLRDYTSLQPELSLHGRTKPPGFALLLYGLVRLVGSGWTTLGVTLTFLGSLLVVPAYFLRAPAEDDSRGRDAALLVAVGPAAVLYGAVTLDGVFAVVAGIVMALTLREAARPHPLHAGLLGVALFTAMMLSYSAFLLLAFVFLFLGWRRWRQPVLLVTHVSLVLGTLLLPFVLLYGITGFDGWECFQVARSLNTRSMSFVTGRELGGLEVWLYTSVGNLLAFLIFLGVPVVVGLIRLPWRKALPEERALMVAFFGTLAVASFGGLYLMETGRIFLFLVPAAAALAVRSRDLSLMAAVGCLGVQAILFEIVMFTIW